jgi:hypothetical protein
MDCLPRRSRRLRLVSWIEHMTAQVRNLFKIAHFPLTGLPRHSFQNVVESALFMDPAMAHPAEDRDAMSSV